MKKNTLTIYFLSGLGADERAFQKLSLDSTWIIRHIKWPQPLPPETLEAYCKRVSQLIDTSHPFSLVGLSFGGIVATELTKTLNPQITIIISSISTRKEMPWQYKLLNMLKIHKLVPSFLLNKVYPFTYWYFGTETEEEKALLRQIIADTPASFLKWAINQIFLWQNNVKPEKVFHVHGSKDRIFPYRNTIADLKIDSGGHFMVYNKADLISKILQEKINSAVALTSR